MVHGGENFEYTPRTGFAFLLVVAVLLPATLYFGWSAWGHWVQEGESRKIAEEQHRKDKRAPKIDLTGTAQVAGMDPNQDPSKQGFELIERAERWSRWRRAEAEVIVTHDRRRKGYGLTSDGLYVSGVRYDPARHHFPSFALAESEIRRRRGDRSPSGQTLYHIGPLMGPAIGEPLCAELLDAYEHKDLEAFSKALTPENSNLRLIGGETILYRAAKDGRVAFVDALLKGGADPNLRDRRAFFAAKKPVIVSLFLKAGVPVDAIDHRGYTKLFAADLEMTEMLLEAGADPNFKQRLNNRTALYYARSQEVRAALVAAGADRKHEELVRRKEATRERNRQQRYRNMRKRQRDEFRKRSER